MLTVITLFIPGCSGIWNASDLAGWVQGRAVEQVCQRETIELDEWYTETADGNAWRGTCRNSRGKAQSFGVNVDTVWTPSKSPT